MEANKTTNILEMDPDSIPGRVFSGLDITPEKSTSTSGWRQAEIPAANGHGNARSVVRAQTAMANGGKAFGVELLSEAGCRRALEPQTDGADLVLGIPVTFGMGYALRNESMPMGPNENTLFWGGAGGSSIVVDMDSHLCLSYVMNQMNKNIIGDPRGFSLAFALFDSL